MTSSDPGGGTMAALAHLTHRLGQSRDLDQVLTAALETLDEQFGFEHSMLLLLDETETTLFTIASHGYRRAGIGSEVRVGEGLIGSVAADGTVRRIGNLQRLLAYARSARDDQADEPAIPLPGLDDANSQLAAPLAVGGRRLGVLAIESTRHGAYTEDDEHLLAVVAHVVAAAIELDRLGQRDGTARADTSPAASIDDAAPVAAEPSVIRFYPVDGSTFIDGDYLIKGVPGRILFRLLREHLESGRTDFTNRELRLDATLELPAFRDNLESRLILLKRRLDERGAPMRIEKTGRGLFRLRVSATMSLDVAEEPPGQ